MRQRLGSVDARLADTPLPDAPLDAAARCDRGKPFGTPVKITELNSAADDHSATLTADELTVLFASSRSGGPGGLDIYIATRPTRSDPWSAPSLINGVNTARQESRPVITADGLFLFSERIGRSMRVSARRSSGASRGGRRGTWSLTQPV